MIVYLMAIVGFVGLVAALIVFIKSTQDDDIEPPRR